MTNSNKNRTNRVSVLQLRRSKVVQDFERAFQFLHRCPKHTIISRWRVVQTFRVVLENVFCTRDFRFPAKNTGGFSTLLQRACEVSQREMIDVEQFLHAH